MSKKILGLDLGSNSVGWALLEENNGEVNKIIDLGCRIFSKAVEEKTPTPKNQKRRDMRLGRRVLHRRAARRQRMLNYLISLDLLPKELQGNHQPEQLLNELGDPYALRVKALDEQLSPHELGRILLHLVARRGFLSNKKQAAGDLVDDPDTIAYLKELDENSDTKDADEHLSTERKEEENAYKEDIKRVRDAIQKVRARTLGEYLHNMKKGECKRNRLHEGGHLRTDRAMYQDELTEIWKKQTSYFPHLPDDFMADKKGIKQIIFYQRPLKLKKNRVGKCSLEPKNNRANMARLEVQRFRYLLDINNLKWKDGSEQWIPLDDKQSGKLADYFECHPRITVTQLKQELGLGRSAQINLESKNLKGNTTACKIREVIEGKWDSMSNDEQKHLFEDLFSIKKKSALKKRLITHWKFDTEATVKLCLLVFEPGHSNHSLKAINKLLPYLEDGMIYSDARQATGYGYEENTIEPQEKLKAPPPTANPIVNKGLHELRRVVNAVIQQHGKPDSIRIEMARDLEMNTTRYKDHLKQQEKNKNANEEAQAKFEECNPGQYASRNEKIKYRLWKDQKECCAYSNESIALVNVFSPHTEIDHILPFKKSLDDSYMNKVICLTAENRAKRDRTPIDAWGADKEKWNQITQAISRWSKSLDSKKKRFVQTESDLQKRDFIETQLNDTRYLSRLAKDYVRQLDCEVSVTKGFVVSEMRHQWGFDSLLGETSKKDRSDHRHHAIDAVVIAATSRSLYTKAVKQIEHDKLKIDRPYNAIRAELDEKLKQIIVSHAPQRKLSGTLHEETGAGYVAKHGGTVYRKALGPDLNIAKIVDATVKKIVEAHLEKFDGDKKQAFADDLPVYHKDGKTPIKRVRVLQANTTEEKLQESKFGVKNRQGEIFKWMAYGNIHHVEIIRHKQTGRFKGEFVTMMEAHRRAMTGSESAIKRGVAREPIVKTEHGDDYRFMMVLHINDTVSVESEDGKRSYYRVQKLDSGQNRIVLRLNRAATIDNKEEEIYFSINQKNFEKYKIKLHRINAIGHLVDD